jgi:crotonobetainyl-CoA:carnitine CoA-transferase CaiB-like acyl-CoA transferase
MREPNLLATVADVWHGLGGPDVPARLIDVSGTAEVYPSVFRVGLLGSSTVAAALLAVREFAAARGATTPDIPISFDTGHLAAAFRSERFASSETMSLPAALWDPIAGDYRTADGWIRIHANYPHHLAAALRVLRCPPERDAVAAVVGGRHANALEVDIVAAGGAAAALRSRDNWRRHTHGATIPGTPLVGIERMGSGASRIPEIPSRSDPDRLLAGVRVIELTRVIAAPLASRFLAAWGADVIRIDQPGFEELPVVRVDQWAGKRSCALDLSAADGRAAFEQLASDADVIVNGLRAGALARRGYGPAQLARLRPGIVSASLSAYGPSGPWSGRRGFDSLVQMSTGIADQGREVAGQDEPLPLPCQALDHATGYLLAAGIVRALSRRAVEGGSWSVQASLARTALLLDDLGVDPSGLDRPDPGAAVASDWMHSLGGSRIVRPVGAIGDATPRWSGPAPAPGADQPVWR